VLLVLPRSLGPLGGSRDELGLATIEPRYNPAHDLESLLSNRTHGVPDLAGEGPLSCIANQSTRTWVQGLKGPGFWVRGSRYYGAYSREVEHVGLGYGTRLSGYTALDPAEDEHISLKPVPRKLDPSLREAEVLGQRHNVATQSRPRARHEN
jgi:hypothetical protein